MTVRRLLPTCCLGILLSAPAFAAQAQDGPAAEGPGAAPIRVRAQRPGDLQRARRPEPGAEGRPRQAGPRMKPRWQDRRPELDGRRRPPRELDGAEPGSGRGFGPRGLGRAERERQQLWRRFHGRLASPGEIPEDLRAELRKHARRVAILLRIRRVAAEAADQQAAQKAYALLQRERRRHREALDVWLRAHPGRRPAVQAPAPAPEQASSTEAPAAEAASRPGDRERVGRKVSAQTSSPKPAVRRPAPAPGSAP